TALAVAVVAVVLDRRLGRRIGDDPDAVVERAGIDRGLARADRVEPFQVGPDRIVEHGPLFAQVVHRDRLHLARGRIGEAAADVGARVLVYQGLLAGRGVDREQRVGVALARIAHVQRGAILGQAGVAGGHAVLERNLVVLLPGLAGAAQQVLAAVRAGARGEAQAVV